MDENVVEELAFHTKTVQSDDNSPLHLIREKEMEISGRVLAAKGEAERMVSEARHRAGEIVRNAESEGETRAKETEEQALAQAKTEAAQLREQVAGEAQALQGRIAERMGAAVAEIVRMVTTV